MLFNRLPNLWRLGRHSSTDLVSRQSSLLPNELWMHILEIAIRPTFIIGDEKCHPGEIERFLTMRAAYKVAATAELFVQTNRKRLGTVCRLWRQLVDAINMEEWVIDVSTTDGSIQRLNEKNPTASSLIPRLNVYVCSAGPLNLDNSHPVLSLTIGVHGISRTVFASLEVLSSIISHPRSLHSVHLTLANIPNLNPSLLHPLADTPLLTLSLITSNYSIFHAELTFPHLSTLSLVLKPTPAHSTEGSRPTLWNLPSLTNLSIKCSTTIQDAAMISFISHLLVRQLKALRIKRPRHAGINISSPTFWRDLPQLQVLATNFSTLLRNGRGQALSIIDLRGSLRSAWPGGIPLRHFIQNEANEPETLIPRLLKYIKHSPGLETVSLSLQEGHSFWELYKKSKAARQLEKICRSRGIRLLDAEGLNIKKIVKSDGLES